MSQYVIIHTSIKQDQETGQFTVEELTPFDKFGLATCGDTLQEAVKNAIDAGELLIRELADIRELRKKLDDKGASTYSLDNDSTRALLSFYVEVPDDV